MTGVDQVERPTGDAIDVVIAWVDGRDRKHRAKRNRYLADPAAGMASLRGMPALGVAFRTMTRSAFAYARFATTRRGSAQPGW